MEEFLKNNWGWLVIIVPAVLLAAQQLVKGTKTKKDDRIFLPILNALVKVFELLSGRRGKK